jgi:3-hydroxymyristoyl/3-hydroxydecanoyl-(acyl carrier protein) dehydratase
VTSLDPLPHGYPFRFVDRSVERSGAAGGKVTALVSAGGRVASGGPLPAGLVAELMAQAALLLSGAGPDPVRGVVLAGLSDVHVERAPEAGDALTVRVALSGRMGPVVKFEAAVLGAGGGRIAAGSFTVRLETPA